jgi:hypothetical protein
MRGGRTAYRKSQCNLFCSECLSPVKHGIVLPDEEHVDVAVRELLEVTGMIMTADDQPC